VLSSQNSPEGVERTREQMGKVEEVLAKTIRVLTNIMISEDIGALVADNHDFVACVLAIIGTWRGCEGRWWGGGWGGLSGWSGKRVRLKLINICMFINIMSRNEGALFLNANK
jgi:hypothetical protein